MTQPVKLKAEITEVIDHAPGLRSFILRPERPVRRFRPGQFLHLAIDPYDPSLHWPESRVFSIASPPEQRDQVRITISVVGRFTRRMMELEAGVHVWIKLPYGDFVIQNALGQPVVLVAGGTGITPFVPWFSSPLYTRGPAHLLYGVRRPEFLIYRQCLEEASLRCDRFGWSAFIEDGLLSGAHSGRLSAEVAVQKARVLADPASVTFYLSGPGAMISSIQAGLVGEGITPKQVRIDAWE